MNNALLTANHDNNDARTKKTAVCLITTTQPTAALTVGGGGGSVVMLDPYTGSIYSSGRIYSDLSMKHPIGISSLSLLNNRNDAYTQQGTSSLAIAYGATSSMTNKGSNKQSNNNNDTYAMLLAIRNVVTIPPHVQWKCRLPESNMSCGLQVSCCSNYIAGGGQSGTLYLWKSVGGLLLRTIKAHYRAITVLLWTKYNSSGQLLITGGTDGMIHVYSLLDLVQENEENTTIQPIRSWSKHHLPITSICSMGDDSSRALVSSSEDGKIIVMEIFSGLILATIQMPSIIKIVAVSSCSSQQRIYAGSITGSIYIIDLNDYSINQTVKQNIGSTVIVHHSSNNTLQHPKTILNESIDDIVFGVGSSNNDNRNVHHVDDDDSKTLTRPYQIELLGHDRSITSIAEVNNNDHNVDSLLLISGDDSGTIRIWDLQSKCCIRIVRPWSHNNATTTVGMNKSENASDSNAEKSSSSGATQQSQSMSSNHQQQHPVTSIRILYIDNDSNHVDSAYSSMFGGAVSTDHQHQNKRYTNNTNSTCNITSLITPLQRYVASSSQIGGVPGNDPYISSNHNRVLVPFMKPKRSNHENDFFWDVSRNSFPFENVLHKRRRYRHGSPCLLPVSTTPSAVSDFNSATTKNIDLMQEDDDPATTSTTVTLEPLETSMSHGDNGEEKDTTIDQQKCLDEIERLKKELDAAKSTIQRWESVNNKLLGRLQHEQQKPL